jgi:hypothetical protein
MNVSLNTLLQRPDIWRIGQVRPRARSAIKTGFEALDQALPDQGWEQGALTELLCNEQGVGELSVLLPAIRQTSEAGRGIVLVAPPYIPLPVAWEAKGVNLQHVIIVRADAADQLWVMEQAARSGACGMVVGWNMQARSHINYQALRRLQLAAESGGTTLVLYRPLQAGVHASPAPTRLTVTAHDGRTVLHLVKRRAALMADTIALNVYPPHWAQHTINAKHATKIVNVLALHPHPIPGCNQRIPHGEQGHEGTHKRTHGSSIPAAPALTPVSISHPPRRSSASR